ncbi:ester cyclase [Amycolatopsis sp. VS8301801F10]|uniref:ester cyclase n=1 Tax=Amycolatopsis sp. VS8301801F10 TaxID=2652442 RepID=UPI0038FC5227
MNNPARTAALAVFDAINTGELTVLDHLVTQDFIDHGSPFPLPPGPAGYRQILTFVHQVLNIRYAIDDVFDTDDRVVLRATATGTGVDAIHGQGTGGKPYRMTTVHIYRTEGPMLAEHWGVRDELGARIQLGALPAFAPQTA